MPSGPASLPRRNRPRDRTRAERSLSAVSDLTGIDPDKIKYTIKRTLGKLRKQPEVRDLLAYLETDDLE